MTQLIKSSSRPQHAVYQLVDSSLWINVPLDTLKVWSFWRRYMQFIYIFIVRSYTKYKKKEVQKYYYKRIN